MAHIALVLLLVIAIVVHGVLLPFLQLSLGTVLGVVDLTAETEVLPALVGSLVVAHLQGHGGVVALVRAQLLVVDGPPGARRGHASLQGE